MAEGTPPGWLARVGLALAAPRWALAVADEPTDAGRAGSDLLRLLGALLVTAHLRRLVAAGWLAVAVDLGAGARGAVSALSQGLTLLLAFLLVAALGVFASTGTRRSLGRAFDLVCVAAVPLVAVELLGTLALRLLGPGVPALAALAVTAVAFAWAGALVALAWARARRAPAAGAVAAMPAEVARRGRRAGVALVIVAAATLAVEITWIARHRDLLRPLRTGDVAPPLVLASIEAGGARGPTRDLAAARGRVVVLDFWATWCRPCLDGLPSLDALAQARAGDGVEVWTINLDDAAAARALFDRAGYGLPLLADDGEASVRYGVTTIPHTVVIDRAGRVVQVHRGGGGAAALARAIAAAE